MNRLYRRWLLLALALTGCARGPSLQQAASAGQLAQIETMLKRGTNVDARDFGGDTALIAAARFGQTKAIKLLLDRGAAIDARGDLDCTALTVAAARGHLAAVKLLVQRGADLTAQGYDGKNALMTARHYKRKPTADWLENYRPGASDGREALEEPEVTLDLDRLMNSVNRR